MQKGEVGNEAYANAPHKVDGMSGATLTGKGVNQMIYDYMKAYERFLRSKRTTQNA
jgi:Na+-transporting NADH:ubiquinone oxidoreductase subunit C